MEVPTLEQFNELSTLVYQLRQEIADLRAQLPEWVDQVETERLTGLSDTSLWRERKNPESLIIWKSDRGIRYNRASLIRYTESRTVVRRRARG